MKPEYAVYKGDRLLAMGTAEECAEIMGVTREYIYWMTTPAAKRRLAKRKNPANATVAFRVDEEDEQ